MKVFRLITKKIDTKQVNLLTGKTIKKARKSSQINLLTGKPIKKAKKVDIIPTEPKVEMQVTVELPIKVEEVIANFPKDLQEFLKTKVILAITSKTDENIFKLENNFEVRVKSVVQQSRHKTLVTIKQGKKQIFKNII